MMRSKIVEWNPQDPTRFLEAFQGRLQLCHINLQQCDARHLHHSRHHVEIEKELDIRVVSPHIECTCLSWHSSELYNAYVAFGLSSGGVRVWNQIDNTNQMTSSSSSIGRPCNDVQWNDSLPQLLAAGFDKSTSNPGEANTFIWDVSCIGSSVGSDGVVCKLYNDEPSCLQWRYDNANELLVGTSLGAIKVIDIRTPEANQFSLIAHTASRPRKMRITGLVVDPFNPFVLASFTDVPFEPVKVWDIRKGSNSKPRAIVMVQTRKAQQQLHSTANGNVSNNNGEYDAENSFVSDVCWCPDRPNVLAVSVSQSSDISLYSTLKAATADSTTSEPVATVDIGEHCKQFKIFDRFKTDKLSNKASNKWKHVVNSNSGRTSVFNMLVATEFGYVARKLRYTVGLSVAANESLAVGVDSTWRLFMSSDSSSSTSRNAHCVSLADHLNIDRLMRLRCQSGYGIVAAKNIQTLTDELDPTRYDVSSSNSSVTVDDATKALVVENIQHLIRVWNWIDRIENMDQLDIGIRTCGIRTLLFSGANATSNRSITERNAMTGAVVYSSLRRCKARLICGWASNVWMGSDSKTNSYFEVDDSGGEDDGSASGSANDSDANVDDDQVEDEIQDIVDECSSNESFERACALAVFQGVIASAVQLLQDTIASLQELFLLMRTSEGTKTVSSANDDEDDNGNSEHMQTDFPNVSEEYVHLLSLVAMCLAGYSCQANPSTAAPASSAVGATKSSVGRTSAAIGGNSAGSSRVALPSNARLWITMCKSLLQQFESDIIKQRVESSYLLAACKFLLLSLEEPNHASVDSVKSFGRYSAVLTDTTLALEDRVGFAVSYLSDNELQVFIQSLVVDSKERGNLEGLALTGIAEEGYEILQRYLDNTSDLQTVALLTSKLADKTAPVVGSADTATSSSSSVVSSTASWLQSPVLNYSGLPNMVSKEFMWLGEYRMLLNKWQLFFERANLDVELGREHRLRSLQQQRTSAKISKSGSNMHVNSGRPPGMSSAANSRSKVTTASQMAISNDRNRSSRNPFYSLPPHYDVASHILLRCNFCSASLPPDQNIPQTQQAFLKKQCPIINCCYHCKKQLPRCYVCSLYMGFVNPLFELNRMLSQRRKVAESALQSDSASNSSTGVKDKEKDRNPDFDKLDTEWNNVLGFGKWFFFCQWCRHGGHASCVEDWFDNSGNAGSSGVEASEAGSNSIVLRRDVCGVAGCNCHCMSLC